MPGCTLALLQLLLLLHLGAAGSAHRRPGGRNTPAAVELFVSPSGSDAAAGDSRDRPWRSLEHTRASAAEHLRTGVSVIVTLLPGTYRLTSTLAFAGPADSPSHPGQAYTWRADPSPGAAAVRLTGSRQIPWAAAAPATDPRIPPAARPHVQVVNLTAAGVGDFGHAGTSGWEFKHPDRLEIFVGGEAMTLARYPNKGAQPDGSIFEGYAMMSAGVAVDGAAKPNAISFTNSWARGLESSRVAGWVATGGLEQLGLWGAWRYQWAEQMIPVSKVDLKGGALVFDCASSQCDDLSYWPPMQSMPYFATDLLQVRAIILHEHKP
eukprot:SAG22_NODE_593_length_8808_cov_21.674590_10_plen_322_part_00